MLSLLIYRAPSILTDSDFAVEFSSVTSHGPADVLNQGLSSLRYNEHIRQPARIYLNRRDESNVKAMALMMSGEPR